MKSANQNVKTTGTHNNAKQPGTVNNVQTDAANMAQNVATLETLSELAKQRNAARLEKMRANLDKLEKRAAEIMQKGDNMTAADRIELLQLVNVAYHASGKIETISSIDSCAACAFCEKMRKAAERNCLLICGYCYAAADAWKEAAWRRHNLNARILSSVLFTEAELITLNIPTFKARINEDGDVINEIHARNLVRIFKTHEYVNFGFWYKNVPAVAAGLKAENIVTRADRPKNVRFVQSSLLIGTPAAPAWFTDVVFTVYPDAETTENAIERGAYECNGRKCKECGFNCYNANKNVMHGVQHVAEVLRCSATMRARIMAAYVDSKKGTEE